MKLRPLTILLLASVLFAQISNRVGDQNNEPEVGKDIDDSNDDDDFDMNDILDDLQGSSKLLNKTFEETISDLANKADAKENETIGGLQSDGNDWIPSDENNETENPLPVNKETVNVTIPKTDYFEEYDDTLDPNYDFSKPIGNNEKNTTNDYLPDTATEQNAPNKTDTSKIAENSENVTNSTKNTKTSAKKKQLTKKKTIKKRKKKSNLTAKTAALDDIENTLNEVSSNSSLATNKTSAMQNDKISANRITLNKTVKETEIQTDTTSEDDTDDSAEKTVLNDEDSVLYIYDKKGYRYSVDIKKPMTNPVPPPSSGVLKANTTYQLKNEAVTFTIDEDLWDDEFFAIEVQGLANLKIELLDGPSANAKVIKTDKVSLILDRTRSFILIQDEEAFQNKNQTIRIQNTDQKGSLDFILLTVIKTSALELPFNMVVKFYAHFAKEIRAKVFTEKSKSKKQSKNRFQFLVESSLSGQNLKGEEVLSMLINYSRQQFPTLKEYELKPSANTGNGLIKTISKNDDGFCDQTEGSCEYHVTIFVAEVEECTFIPSLIKNGDQVKFSESVLWLDEIETNEEIEYNFLPESEQKNTGFAISFKPLENHSECFVSIGEKPFSEEDYMYHLKGDRKEDIFVSQNELSAFNIHGRKIWVKFTGLVDGPPATLLFRIKLIGGNDLVTLSTQSTTHGIQYLNELVSYFIDFSDLATEDMDIQLGVAASKGKTMLIVKECVKDEYQCLVTAEDAEIAKSESKFHNSTKGLRFSSPIKSPGDHWTETLYLNFQCAGSKINTKSLDYYPVSDTCSFAIGVLSYEGKPTGKIPYELDISGGSNHIGIKDLTALSIKTNALTVNFYRFPMSTSISEDVSITIKTYVLTGSGTLYISQINAYPNENNYLHKLEMIHETSAYLKTKVYELNFTLPAQKVKSSNMLYFSYEANSNSIFDLYVSQTSSKSNHMGEKLVPNQGLRRALDNRSIYSTKDGQMVAYHNFLIDLQNRNSTEPIKTIEIGLNSEVFNLLICVYSIEEGDTLNLFQPCDFVSRIDYIKIFKESLLLANVDKFVVSVQRNLTEYQLKDPHFSVEFTISTSYNSEETRAQLDLPGSSYRGYLSAEKEIIIDINLEGMKTSGFVVFWSEDPDVSIVVDKETEFTATLIGTLNSDRFGFIIPKADAFRSLYCDLDCRVRLLAKTTSKQPALIQITFTYDDHPIMLKDGTQYRMPNNIRTYYVNQPGNYDQLSFVAYTGYESSVAYSKIMSEAPVFEDNKIESEISEIDFDLKTDILPNTQLVYSKNELKMAAGKHILFMLDPKFNYQAIEETIPVTFFNIDNIARVYIKSKTVKLESFSQVTDTVALGEVNYYLVELPNAIDFSIATMNVIGDIDMLVEKGADAYPNTERFWKKARTTTGDVVVITTDMYKENMNSYVFVVGVYGRTAASYTIVMLAEFSKLLKVEFQKIMDIKLDPKTYFYLDFYDSKGTFDSIFYADGSDVEIAFLDYDKRQGQDIISMISNKDNYYRRIVFKAGDVPLNEINREGELKKTHLVLRLLPLEGLATANVVIYDPKLPIVAPGEKRFHFAMNAFTENVFKVHLSRETQIVDIDVKLFFGKVSVSVGHKIGDWGKTITLMDEDQKYTQYQMTDNANDIIIFQTIYLKVDAPKFSKFSILVKPKNKFKRLIEGEPEIVYADPDSETILYYEVTARKRQTITSLKFEINSVNYYNDLPDLLYLSPDNEFTSNSMFLPMPLLDVVDKDVEELRQRIADALIDEGTYVIRIRPNPNKSPVRVTVVLNNVRVIEENGLYRGVVPVTTDDMDSYSLFLSETGEFRLLMESCSTFLVKDLLFEPKVAGNNANIDPALFQAFPCIQIDESKVTTQRELRKITYPFIRGLITGAGRLSFKIAKTVKSESAVNSFNRTYVMMSEFRPVTKSLILKDYIDIFKDKQSFDSFFVYYDFVHSQSSLRLTIRQPTFKMQLLDDYPDLQSVKLRLKIYLFSEENFMEQIERCGISSLDRIKKREQFYTVKLTRDQLKQATNDNIELLFTSAELVDFDEKNYLNVMCYVSARFYENEDEEWQVTMDLKYTNVPYFFLTIKNKRITKRMFQVLFMVVMFVCILMIVMAVVFFNRQRKAPQPEIVAIRPADLETSAISMNTEERPQTEDRNMFEI